MIIFGIAGNSQGRKLSQISQLGSTHKHFLHKLWVYATSTYIVLIPRTFSTLNVWCTKFLPARKLPTVTVHIYGDDYRNSNTHSKFILWTVVSINEAKKWSSQNLIIFGIFVYARYQWNQNVEHSHIYQPAWSKKWDKPPEKMGFLV